MPPSDALPPVPPTLPPPIVRTFGDDAARATLAQLPGPYLPWSAGAMRPAGLVMVCNDIVLGDRRRIAELGSGISTVLMSRLLYQRHGAGRFRLCAVEHDERWAHWVTEQLGREGLGGGDAVVIHAPLADHPLAPEGLRWYGGAELAAGLDDALGGGLVDLLLIDGPPAFAAGHGLARYPALPVLRDRLAPGATVVVDDVERPGEQEVLRRWEAEIGLRFERHPDDAGVAIVRLPVGG